MAYSARIKVVMVQQDETTKNTTSISRRDMYFTVPVDNPSEIAKAAKDKFKESYGPDLVVITANLQGRKECVLYCMQKSQVKKVKSIAAESGYKTRTVRAKPNL